MYLGISCVCENLYIALFNKNLVLISLKREQGSYFQTTVLSFIEEFFYYNNMSFDDIKGIIVNNGPASSLTGLRLSITLAKTLSFVKNYDLYEISSHDLLHNQYLTVQQKSLVLAILDGKQGRVFGQIFYNQKAISPIQDIFISSITEYIQKIKREYPQETLKIIGNGVNVINEKEIQKSFFNIEYDISVLEPSIEFITKESIKKVSFKEFLPKYYRKTQAQENYKA